MRPVVLSVTGAGVSKPAPMDYLKEDFKIGFGCVVDGTVTYKVQHSFDDPFANYPTDYNTDANWFDHETVVAESDNQDGNYAFNIRAVRLNITAGTGTVTGTFLQGH